MGLPGFSLVSERTGVYPAHVSGRFTTARRWVGAALITLLVGLPWVRIGGFPAARIDLPGRKLLLFGGLFTPHDTWALALLGLLCAIGLFFFASVMGRVWCGWACPQTVWLHQVFLPIERLIEGPAHRRRKRDAGPRDGAYFRVKIGKHLAFLAGAGLVTGVVLSWFVGGPELLRGEVGPTGIATGSALFALLYADIAWFREQLCIYACPYARFQGALMDERSLIVAYDAARGEPRRDQKTGAGDCIDCRRCVQVCPNGIDIRDGDQLQCVSCASCVDACDGVMVRIGKPKGLIAYRAGPDRLRTASALSLRGGSYLALSTAIVVALAVALERRPDTVANLARAPSESLFQALPGGAIANQFVISLTNRSPRTHAFTVVGGAADIAVTAPGAPWAVRPGDELRTPLFVAAPVGTFAAGRRDAALRVLRDDGVELPTEAPLLGPDPRLAFGTVLGAR